VELKLGAEESKLEVWTSSTQKLLKQASEKRPNAWPRRSMPQSKELALELDD
jgi:hypothetical protein